MPARAAPGKEFKDAVLSETEIRGGVHVGSLDRDADSADLRSMKQARIYLMSLCSTCLRKCLPFRPTIQLAARDWFYSACWLIPFRRQQSLFDNANARTCGRRGAAESVK
jgi:hypothetical protein